MTTSNKSTSTSEVLTEEIKEKIKEVRPDFARLLQDHSREQLLALCLRMLLQHPDMDYLIDLPAPVPLESPDEDSEEITVSPLANIQTVDLNPIRRKIQKAFRSHANEDYRDYYEEDDPTEEIAEEIRPLLDVAEGYRQAGQWTDAQAVYRTVATEILEADDSDLEESALDTLLQECGDGLLSCLEAQTSLPESARFRSEARAQLLEFLYELWDSSSVGLDEERMAATITEAERLQLEIWLRQGMKSGTGYTVEYANRARVDFLLKLQIHSGISDEEKLAEYRRYSLWQEATQLLLEMGRIDEAIQEAREQLLTPTHFMAFADRLLRMGEESREQALALVAERQQAMTSEELKRDNLSYLEWLGSHYAAHDHPGEALGARQQQFTAQPGLSAYRKVQEAANLAGNPAETWDTLRPQLIATLEAKQSWGELVTLYLEDKDARAALDALKENDNTGKSWYGQDLHARVAQLAGETYPDEAITLYKRLAENLIVARGRGNYQTAAAHLARARILYERLGQREQWSSYIYSLRDRNKGLRALQEELRAQKLIA